MVNRQLSEAAYIDDDENKPDGSSENLKTSRNNMIVLVWSFLYCEPKVCSGGPHPFWTPSL